MAFDADVYARGALGRAERTQLAGRNVGQFEGSWPSASRRSPDYPATAVGALPASTVMSSVRSTVGCSTRPDG